MTTMYVGVMNVKILTMTDYLRDLFKNTMADITNTGRENKYVC